jgi:hypothetical protein
LVSVRILGVNTAGSGANGGFCGNLEVWRH